MPGNGNCCARKGQPIGLGSLLAEVTDLVAAAELAPPPSPAPDADLEIAADHLDDLRAAELQRDRRRSEHPAERPKDAPNSEECIRPRLRTSGRWLPGQVHRQRAEVTVTVHSSPRASRP